MKSVDNTSKVRVVVTRAEKENLHGSLRPGVRVHVSGHGVANKAPSPAGYRMLHATGKHTRRLYRPDDIAHPLRKGKIKPNAQEIPERYRDLLGWYDKEYVKSRRAEKQELDPILALRGLGKEIWGGEDPDAYVRRLREGWE